MNAPMRSSQLRRISVVPRAMKFFLRVLESLSKGSLILSLPNGSVRRYAGAEHGTSAALNIHDNRFAAAVLRNAEIGLAEAYRDGWCTTPDLTKLLTLAIENEAALNRIFYANPVLNIAYRAAHWLRANTRRGSRRNIAAHYDLSNDFYAQWLDPTMSYSSAMFSGDATADLKFAQELKYQRIIDRLGISHTHHVLEIGCGWGGFAEYAARHAGAKVTGITISQAQLDYGLARIHRAGLTDRVELKFCDYRDVTGKYDRIVSIEMFEAVGERYWADFFAVVTARLKSKGRALVQTITIADELFAQYRLRVDFIQRYIFPGGMLPSSSRFTAEVKRAGLAVLAQHNFGRDYADTLRRWRRQFAQKGAQLDALGFDSAFQRLWQFYFCYCEAGFDSARTDVMQIELGRDHGA
jgi:cyclopropane-fatty-acyl-phospholipid synthase